MIAVISPAKNIDEKPFAGSLAVSIPLFADRADHLVSLLKGYNVEELMSLYKVSRSIAELNALRLASWGSGNELSQSKPAMFAFNGEVYRGISPQSLTDEEVEVAQANIRILSGLYGILRPMDAIRPYRLEMGTHWGPDGLTSLYHYWSSSVTEVLRSHLADSAGDKVLVNLASAEYFKVVDTKTLGYPVLHIDFKQEENGKLKNITVYAKKARGLMARFIASNGILKANDLKAFSDEGYFFDTTHSSQSKWIFVR
jgi:uncharacterized protein